MKIIGLTGSIAMGKSEVAQVFRQHNIPVFDADREVHALYDSAEGVALLADLVPQAITDNRIDRQALSKAVMADPNLLERLEKIVHAAVAKRRESFIATARSANHRIVVVDVPLLFEKGHEKDVDITLVVSAPEEDQRRRALARPGMTVEKLDMILKRQMPDHEKRKRADMVVENTGSLEELRQKTETIIANMRSQS